MARVLYLSHDGLMEPLGQSQVWQYLCMLSKNHQITLVTFEKENDWRELSKRKAMIAEAKETQIRWLPLKYHKNPKILGPVFDIIVCFLVSTYLTLRYRIKIIHARNAPFTLIAMVLKIFGTHFIFDMRGFWADERVDGGLWKKNGMLHRINKWLEKHYFLKSDAVVVLTKAAVNEISKFDYLKRKTLQIEIIPTCTNLELFQPKKLKSADENSFTLGYLGNAGTWYLFEPVLDFFNILREFKPEAKMLFINNGQHEYIRSRLEAFKIPESCFKLETAVFNRSAEAISRMDAVVFFIKPVFSKKSSMPTKLGELFACGVPCLTNKGIGDIDEILDKEQTGVLISEFTRKEMKEAARKLLELTKDPGLSSRCVKAAEKYFSLDRGVQTYDRIYRRLAE